MKENGGCSMGFGNFYKDYVLHSKLNAGFIGDAYSLMIKAKDAYDIEYPILEKNPREAMSL